MLMLTTTIEIAASPAIVRQKFLQFDQIPKYSPNGFFKWIGPKTPNTPLEPGTIMHNMLQGMTIDPIILENSPSCFRWRGTFHNIFNGEHMFRFVESEITPGGTTFIHEEQFSGILGGIMDEGTLGKVVGLREKTRKGFEGYNRDLKAWIESSLESSEKK